MDCEFDQNLGDCIAELKCVRDERDLLEEALRKIASCESMVDGDVVSVARDALRTLEVE